MTARGLSQQEAEARLAAEGANELPAAGRRTPWVIVRGVVTEPMFSLLLGAGLVYLLLGDLREASVLVIFLTFSALITVVQEIRSERVLDALRDLTSPRALVIRDGQPRRIAGREVVRGDLLLLKEGDRVPADALVLSGAGLLTDESLLTGESAAVRKEEAREAAETAIPRPGGEGLPYVYAGTLVVRGSGSAVVLATGLRSEIGKIGQALASIESEPPRLRQETRRFVRIFATLALSLCILVTLANGLLHGAWLKAFLGGIALAMSLLPEEFPMVLAIFMVMGAWRISKARVLTRRAAAIETLGSATVLCTDKTGTLTWNRMSVACLQRDSLVWEEKSGQPLPPELTQLATAGALASQRDSYDPMDAALCALRPPAAAAAPVFHYPLTPALLAMANAYAQDSGYSIAAKGAPEAIARLCALDTGRLEELKQAVDLMAAQGMRVLGIAKAVLPAGALPETLAGLRLEFLGLAGFADPLRETVPAAVREAREAGIRVIMVTGDYPATARAIASQAGLSVEEVVTGDDLEKMTDDGLRDAVRTASVFARIMPEQKLRIVSALKDGGEIVAMTGDGVNDAPSLKAAHIGIAMGGRGTDVAREASSIVLLDDDFNSLVRTIRLGRRIYDNLQKAFLYIIAVHVPIAGFAVLTILSGMPLILTPLLIALLEMVIDPTCSIVLEAEEEEKDVMARPPRDPLAPMLSRRLLGLGLTQGLLALALAAGLWLYAQHRALPEDEIRSLVFAALMAINLALILANRSFSASLSEAFRRPNPFLWKGIPLVLAAFSLLLLWPPARDLFHFGPLHAHDAGVAAGAGAILLALLEVAKIFWRQSAQPKVKA